MKKFFDTTENITDKAFAQSIVISLLGIVLCIVALCSATYAWFVADISSSQNTISAAFFDVDVTVYDVTQIVTAQPAAEGESTAESEQTTPPAPIPVTADYGIYTLEAAHVYQLVLSASKEATASKGYCDIAVDGVVVCRTGIIENTDSGALQITITAEGNAKLMVYPKWGVPPADGLQTIGQTFTITATSSAADDSATEPTEPAATEPAATEPATTEPATTEPAATEPETNNA